MDIKLFDNYEDDGQLCLFGAEEQTAEPAERGQTAEKGNAESERPADIRIKSCSSCGKLLYVREEKDAFYAECNNCGIKYSQKR